MIEDVLLYLVAMALVFAVNIVPAFMPATWMVLAFFRIQFGLPLLALSIGGSIIAATGRWALAKGSALFSRRFMKGQQSDMRELGEFLDEHRQHVGLATFLYTLSPLPSNNLFIAAGMVEIQLVWVFIGFLSGRLIRTPCSSGRPTGRSGISRSCSPKSSAAGRRSSSNRSACSASCCSRASRGRAGCAATSGAQRVSSRRRSFALPVALLGG